MNACSLGLFDGRSSNGRGHLCAMQAGGATKQVLLDPENFSARARTHRVDCLVDTAHWALTSTAHSLQYMRHHVPT